MKKRGSVILHVLVTAVVVALVMAMILRGTFLRSLMTTRSHKAAQMRRSDESTLAVLNSNWDSNGVCSNFSSYSCTGSAGSCGCTCTSAGEPTIVTASVGAVCQIKITSPDLMPPPQ
jgi:hypothetical protein